MNYKKQNLGFSIAEVLVTIFVISLVGIAINQFQASSTINSRLSQSKILAADQARLTIRRFLEEVRTASQSSTGAYAIALTNDNALTFYADLYSNGLKERIRYFIDSKGALKKGIVKPTGSPLTYVDANEVVSTLTGPLSNPQQKVFFYYDTNDNLLTLATPSLVRSVRALLVMSTDPRAPSTTVSFESRATFRNLKDNY